MKYETWKLLTKEEKEEYDFKFERENNLSLSILLSSIILKGYLIYWLFLTMFFSYANLADLSLDITTLNLFAKGILASIKLIPIAILLFVIMFILDLLLILIKQNQEKKWLDKRLYIEIIDGKQIFKRKKKNKNE